MTSQKFSANKISASFDFKRALRSLIAPSIVSLLTAIYYFVFLVYCNFWTFYDRTDHTAFVENVRKYIALGLTYTGYEPLLYSGNVTSITICLTAICVGVLFAFSSYRFLMKKKCVNVYLSLGVDRRTIFKNRTVASMLLMAVTSAVPIIIDIIMNIHFLGDPAYIISNGFYVFLEYYTFMLVGFSMMSIAMVICNNVIEGLVFGAGFILSPTVLLGSLHMLFSVYLRGYGAESFFSSGINSGRSLLNHMSIFNPICFGKPFGNYGLTVNVFSFTYRGVKHADGSDVAYGSYTNYGKEVIPFEYMLPVIIWLAVCAVFILVARKLFLARKAENAGMYGANNFVNVFIASEISIFASAIVMYLFGYNQLNVKLNGILNLVIGVLVFTALYFVILSIAKRKIKPSKKTVIPSAVTACLICITVAVLSSGGFGYTTRIPDFEDIKYAKISSNAIEASGNQYCKDADRYIYSNGEVFNCYYDADFALFTDENDLKKLAEVHKNLAETTNNMTGCKVSVSYVLKDGSVMKRTYYDTDYDAYYNILSLTDTDAYRNELKYLMSSEEKDNNGGNISKISNGNFDYNCFFYANEGETKQLLHNCDAKLVMTDGAIKPIKNTDALKDALLADMLSMTYEEIYNSSEKPMAAVLFIDDIWIEENSQTYSADGTEVYDTTSSTVSYNIYPSMTNTINYLKSTGEYDLITEDDAIEKYEITSAQVMKFSDARQVLSTENIIDENNISYLFGSNLYNIFPYGKYGDEGGYNSAAELFKSVDKITDAEKIRALSDVSTTFGYASPDDYIVYFENDKNAGYTVLIRADEVPDFVK